VWPCPAPAGLGDAFAAGERAVHRVLAGLTVVEVAVDPDALHNVNAPPDLLGPGEHR